MEVRYPTILKNESTPANCMPVPLKRYSAPRRWKSTRCPIRAGDSQAHHWLDMGTRVLVLAVLLCTMGAAQTGMSKAKKYQAKAAPDKSIPVYEIDLSEDSDYQPLPWPKEMQGDFVENDCIGDGNVYVFMS